MSTLSSMLNQQIDTLILKQEKTLFNIMFMYFFCVKTSIEEACSRSAIERAVFQAEAAGRRRKR